HNHAPGTTLLYEVLVGNPFEVEFVTIRSIVDKLRARAQETPAGRWVEGYFFDDTKVKDQRLLNVHDLDEVSKEHPVAVHHRGGYWVAMQQVRARGDLRHRVSYEGNGRVLEAMITSGIATGFGDEWIRLGATSEHTVDGSFSERTMALSIPYPGVTPPYKG